MIVVDASLAVKWYLAEADSGGALMILASNRQKIACPDLVVIEVAAAFVRRANMNKAEVPDMDHFLTKWAQLLDEGGLELIQTTSKRMRAAATLAMSLGHPLKDCIYLALAIELDCDFITCDGRFAAKAAELFPRTKMLQDFAV
jgi:predicted nucleic acid-binding protein